MKRGINMTIKEVIFWGIWLGMGMTLVDYIVGGII